MINSFCLQPNPSVSFPRFAFGPNSDQQTVQVTHHYLDVSQDNENLKVLRRRTDTLSLPAARDLYGALLKLGFKRTK